MNISLQFLLIPLFVNHFDSGCSTMQQQGWISESTKVIITSPDYFIEVNKSERHLDEGDMFHGL